MMCQVSEKAFSWNALCYIYIEAGKYYLSKQEEDKRMFQSLLNRHHFNSYSVQLAKPHVPLWFVEISLLVVFPSLSHKLRCLV